MYTHNINNNGRMSKHREGYLSIFFYIKTITNISCIHEYALVICTCTHFSVCLCWLTCMFVYMHICICMYVYAWRAGENVFEKAYASLCVLTFLSLLLSHTHRTAPAETRSPTVLFFVFLLFEQRCAGKKYLTVCDTKHRKNDLVIYLLI